eukprot:TRINITY_DN1236_c0_g1_i1.p1 TRINITY_DN1236_c0_g1~~TRINITY_DN1236_c0_g1_i1.p1  ORF type:complete len:179 (-),score=60.23 TRINITY_DN1236_c0_g1_i1:103-618(-)
MRLILAIALLAVAAQALAQTTEWQANSGCYVEGPYSCQHTVIGDFQLTMFRGSWGLRFLPSGCYVTGTYRILNDVLTFSNWACDPVATNCPAGFDCASLAGYQSVDQIQTAVDNNKNDVCEAWSATDADGAYTCQLRASDIDVSSGSSAASTLAVSTLAVVFATMMAMFLQ